MAHVGLYEVWPLKDFGLQSLLAAPFYDKPKITYRGERERDGIRVRCDVKIS
jgi:hypothetical protein